MAFAFAPLFALAASTMSDTDTDGAVSLPTSKASCNASSSSHQRLNVSLDTPTLLQCR